MPFIDATKKTTKPRTSNTGTDSAGNTIISTTRRGRNVIGGSSYTPKTTPPVSGISQSDQTKDVFTRAGIKDTSGLNIDAINKIATTTEDYYPRYTPSEQSAEDYLGTFKAPQSKEEIQGGMLKSAQGEINALNEYYSNKLKEQKGINQQEEQASASVSTLTGLAGSTEANVRQSVATAKSKQETDAIKAEQQMNLQKILSDIRTSAQTEATAQATEARQSAETVLKNREVNAMKAVESIKNLATSGVTSEGYKATDPEGYAYLASKAGGEEQLKAMFTLNKPVESIIDKKIEGGKYIIAYENPLDGKIRIETVDLGLPVGYSKTVDAGDRILAIPDDWSGDPSELITINKGLTPGQVQTNANKVNVNADEQLYAGLSSPTATAVRSRVTKFSSEPIVQNFATVQEGYNFAQSLSDTTTNPADDQALIYSLAKALDPGSVVREGEYATAQKYSQSWINAYGKGIEQALLGTGFLSEQARKNIKQTIKQKYGASDKSYNNLYNNYKKGINSLTGRDDGDAFLVDYSTQASDIQGGTTMRSPDGTQEVDTGELTPEQIQEAKDAGWI